MEELDWIFDRDDVRLTTLVDVLQHRRHCGRLARSRYTGNENEAAWCERKLHEHGRQVQLVQSWHSVRHDTKSERKCAALQIHVHAEPADPWNAGGEVGLTFIRELLELLRCHELLREANQVVRAQGGGVEGNELTVHAQHWRPSPLEVAARRSALHHLLQPGLDVEARARRGALRQERCAGVTHSDLFRTAPGHTPRDVDPRTA